MGVAKMNLYIFKSSKNESTICEVLTSFRAWKHIP